ncbi:MAG: hypothetical protein JWN08_3802 [Frankiales bacterium]|nr:hypothetical protein [Frankiales bacterium]
MNNAARRRLALGGIATTSALVAGLLIAPSALAIEGGLTITPSSAEGTNTAAVLTFGTTEADLRYGGTATFSLVGASSTFSAAIPAGGPSGTADRSQAATLDLTDVDGDASTGSTVGLDGPADSGVYNVSVTGATSPILPGGGGDDSRTSGFTVIGGGPVAVTSASPSAIEPGNDLDVSLLGNNFERGSVIEVLLPNGTVDSAITTSAAPLGTDTAPDTDDITRRIELRRRWVVAGSAAPGTRNVRVTNRDGNTATCVGCFSVAGAPLTSVTPTGGTNDSGQAAASVTFTGTQVTNGEMLLEYVGDPGSSTRGALTLRETNPAASTSTGTAITGTFDLSDAAPGPYQPVVRSTDGVVNAARGFTFTVLQRGERTPTLASVDRTGTETGSSQAQGSTATYDVVGTNFSRGAAVVVSGTGVTTTAVEFVSATLLRATLQTTAAAAVGARNVTVTLTDGKTATRNASFTVTATGASASPSPSSPSPSPSPSATPTATVPGRYVGLSSPLRVLDTRTGGAPRRTGLITLDLSSQITDSAATAAVLNVTVTNGSARGFLVAYPDGTTKPGTSNVNFEGEKRATATTPASAGTQANEVVVRLPANRRVSLFVDSASAHVIADLVGSFTSSSSAGGRVITQAPVRALDTRTTSTPTRQGEVVLDLSSRLPATSTAAILNVTVTRTAGRGFVTVYPTGTTRPGTSNVNFEAGQTQANEVTTQVGTGANAGRVSLFVDSAFASVIVDVVGAVTAQPVAGTQAFTALATPVRALDTRDDRGARRSGNVTVVMPAVVPAGATGVVLNVTATNGSAAGFVTVFPTGQPNPGTSNVNFPPNLTQANEVVSALGSNRSVTAFVGGGGSPSAHVIVDVVGYLTPQSAPAASASPSPTGFQFPLPIIG